jgi:hypothetical protein
MANSRRSAWGTSGGSPRAPSNSPPTRRTHNDLQAGPRKGLAAEEQFSEAERARDEAYGDLDEALRVRGWQREFAGFDARLYSQAVGSELVTLDQVLAFEMRAVA